VPRYFKSYIEAVPKVLNCICVATLCQSCLCGLLLWQSWLPW